MLSEVFDLTWAFGILEYVCVCLSHGYVHTPLPVVKKYGLTYLVQILSDVECPIRFKLAAVLCVCFAVTGVEQRILFIELLGNYRWIDFRMGLNHRVNNRVSSDRQSHPVIDSSIVCAFCLIRWSFVFGTCTIKSLFYRVQAVAWLRTTNTSDHHSHDEKEEWDGEEGGSREAAHDDLTDLFFINKM